MKLELDRSGGKKREHWGGKYDWKKNEALFGVELYQSFDMMKQSNTVRNTVVKLAYYVKHVCNLWKKVLQKVEEKAIFDTQVGEKEMLFEYFFSNSLWDKRDWKILPWV